MLEEARHLNQVSAKSEFNLIGIWAQDNHGEYMLTHHQTTWITGWGKGILCACKQKQWLSQQWDHHRVCVSTSQRSLARFRVSVAGCSDKAVLAVITQCSCWQQHPMAKKKRGVSSEPACIVCSLQSQVQPDWDPGIWFMSNWYIRNWNDTMVHYLRTGRIIEHVGFCRYLYICEFKNLIILITIFLAFKETLCRNAVVSSSCYLHTEIYNCTNISWRWSRYNVVRLILNILCWVYLLKPATWTVWNLLFHSKGNSFLL